MVKSIRFFAVLGSLFVLFSCQEQKKSNASFEPLAEEQTEDLKKEDDQSPPPSSKLVDISSADTDSDGVITADEAYLMLSNAAAADVPTLISQAKEKMTGEHRQDFLFLAELDKNRDRKINWEEILRLFKNASSPGEQADKQFSSLGTDSKEGLARFITMGKLYGLLKKRTSEEYKYFLFFTLLDSNNDFVVTEADAPTPNPPKAVTDARMAELEGIFAELGANDPAKRGETLAEYNDFAKRILSPELYGVIMGVSP